MAACGVAGVWDDSPLTLVLVWTSQVSPALYSTSWPGRVAGVMVCSGVVSGAAAQGSAMFGKTWRTDWNFTLNLSANSCHLGSTGVAEATHCIWAGAKASFFWIGALMSPAVSWNPGAASDFPAASWVGCSTCFVCAMGVGEIFSMKISRWKLDN
ncbi:MAG: hypothetical protein U0176_04650 [Bacteroidia bacterium]